MTKGARHKIVLSITKLRERQNVLRQMEKEILESCNLKQALMEIKGMLNTPMRRYTPPSPTDNNTDNKTTDMSSMSTTTNSSGVDSNDNKMMSTPPLSPIGVDGDSIPEGDLPGQVTRVLGKGEVTIIH